MLQETVQIIGKVSDDIADSREFEKSKWRVGYFKDLKKDGSFTVTKKSEMADLIVGTVVRVPLVFLKRNEHQPRIVFNKKDLDELKGSILLKGDVNIPIAITIRNDENGLPFGMLVGGERRMRACKMAKLTYVSCLVKPPMDDRELFDASAADNIGKEPLTPLEEALVVHRYIEEFHFTEAEIAKRLAKSPQTIRKIRRYLDLSPQIIKMLFEDKITRAEALILSKYESDDQLRVCNVLKQVKEENKKSSMHPNDLDLLVIRKAEEQGMRRISKAKRGKRQEQSVDLAVKKIVRTAGNIQSVMEMAVKIKKEELLCAKTNIVDILGELEDAKKSLDKVIEKFNGWA